jgi:hypothetical protein
MSDPLINVNRRTKLGVTALFLIRCSMTRVGMAVEDRFLLRPSVASSAVDHSPYGHLLLLLLLQVVEQLMSDPLIDVNRCIKSGVTALFLMRCSMIGVGGSFPPAAQRGVFRH